MLTPKNIVLLAPLREPDRLDAFVERCLDDAVELVAVGGPGAQIVEGVIDEMIVGEGSDTNRFLVTSMHATRSEAIDFALDWNGAGTAMVVRL